MDIHFYINGYNINKKHIRIKCHVNVYTFKKMDTLYCKICDKKYSSYKSMWNHNKKFHTNPCHTNVIPLSYICNTKVIPIKIETDKPFLCSYCNRGFKNRQNKWKHENKYCNLKNESSSNMNKKLQEENNIIKKENKELHTKLNELLKLCKIHPKTLQKINKQLVNTGTINNINNTINIVKFGSEDLNKIFSQSEILKVLNRKMLSLEESIKTIHFNDNRPEFKNIYITNLKDQYAYIYDGNKFIAVLKSDILEELVDNHFENIELSVDEYKEKLQPKTIDVLDKFIDKMNNDEEFIDNEHKKTYPNYKSYNINKIKLMIYNNTDKKIVNVICEKNELSPIQL